MGFDFGAVVSHHEGDEVIDSLPIGLSAAVTDRLGRSRPQLKIGEAVVQPVAVLVVYMLERLELPAEMYLYDEPVLANLPTTRHLDDAVAVLADRALTTRPDLGEC